jgi:aspartyl-tRNA(Asn)/glutamyl-tRNA(Gln) amidotransferase subunit B
MAVYEPVIGLEIHAELKTQTKMFCGSRNDSDEIRPNANVCPVCMAHPGTLPVINKEAVRSVLKVGVALGSQLADYTEFDRKNYFYPDLPKGYQLSQFEYPLVVGGALKGVEITRVHLEEDTASSMHNESTGVTTIDYNRAGVPLMELVTEPVITSAQQAGDFARELQTLLRYLGVSEANMEKGEMRVEANVSLAKNGARSAAYVELKNINSFRVMEKAVAYEIQRQQALLEEGGTVVKETRGWDDAKQATFSQRVKEGGADYRYFPDPDLPSLKLSELEGMSAAELQKTMPELPQERRNRYLDSGVKPDDAELFVRDTRFGDFFDAVSSGYDAKSTLVASNYVANDLVKVVRDIELRDSSTIAILPITSDNFKKLVDMILCGMVSSRAAKDILLALATDEGIEPIVYAQEHNLLQNSDSGQLEATVDAVIAGNPEVVAELRAGKASAIEFLLGQCMKALRGAGNPAVLRELLIKKTSE